MYRRIKFPTLSSRTTLNALKRLTKVGKLKDSGDLEYLLSRRGSNAQNVPKMETLWVCMSNACLEVKMDKKVKYTLKSMHGIHN